MLQRGEFDDLVEMAKVAPEEIQLFPVRMGPYENSILVAVAISAEAKADLERSLPDGRRD
jgi:hypothetical protein